MADTPDTVVAIGASAGGVEALSRVAAGLPADAPFAVLMALHLPAHGPSVLAQIIDRAGPLPAVTAQDGMRLEAGRIYVAVPGRHLMTEDHRIVLSHGPTENGYRPALNALFRSVAVAFGPHAIGVLMSGVLDDGVRGLAAIRARGGTTVCQSPEDAAFPAMPSNALRAGVVDRVADAADIGVLIDKLRREPATAEPAVDPLVDQENRIALSPTYALTFDGTDLGPPSGYTCPDCHGSLQSVGSGHFRCQVGHGWSAEALLAARDHEVHNALWTALRSLDEKARLARHLAEKAVTPGVRERYRNLADSSARALAILQHHLNDVDLEPPEPHE
jgi:two-component system, chemotaxis family, protein-glutamate methylesterase/glutaminase